MICQIVDQCARTHRRAAKDHLADTEITHRAVLAFYQRANLGQNVVCLTVVDLERPVSCRVESLLKIGWRRLDLNGDMPGIHDVGSGKFEHVRRTAAMHGFGEHQPAVIGIVSRPANHDARRIRRVIGGTGNEILKRLVTEIFRRIAWCMRLIRHIHRPWTRHLFPLIRQGNRLRSDWRATTWSATSKLCLDDTG